MEKIALLHDTSTSSNWGCKATVWGLKSFISDKIPGCTIESVPLSPLPFSKLKVLRTYRENKLIDAVLAEDTDKIKSGLKSLNFDCDASIKDCNVLILNGEGSVHRKSGHVVRLLAILYLMKKLGKKCYSTNQSIDFNHQDKLSEFVKKVYNEIDFVTVRESRSKKTLDMLGVKSSMLPDFAFLNNKNYLDVNYSENLGDYICVTGSSILNKKSFSAIDNLIGGLRDLVKTKILFLASTKTDVALAKYAKRKYSDLEIIDSSVNYLEIMNIIKKSKLLVGGRFHPTIFSMIVHTPFVPFCGNSHKMEGLIEMSGLSIPVCQWDNKKLIKDAISLILSDLDRFNLLVETFLKDVSKSYTNFDFSHH